MLFRKEVKAVTITYSDGEVETYHPIQAIHTSRRGYDKGLPNPSKPHTEHEIRWRELDKE